MESSISISKPPKILKGSVRLPGSKSESNRALLLKALSGGQLIIRNLSFAEDTVCMDNLLKKIEKEKEQKDLTLDVGPAGTVMRFLTAYLSLEKGSFILTGSPRMLQRPIQILVESLITLGADIEYLGKIGYPPIRIQGKKWTGNKIKIPGNISSQYISALLLIAPNTPRGLEIEIDGELTSAPYVEMTLQMMELIGIKIEKTKTGWFVPNQEFRPSILDIEPDWSGASYWYSLAAFSSEVDLELSGLRRKSLQADRSIVEMMKGLGISTSFTENGAILGKNSNYKFPKKIDFKTCPDIAQTIMVIAAGLNINLECIGLETLKIKETDRIEAIKNELLKIGVQVLANSDSAIINGEKHIFPKEVEFHTYHDHRMAMALAPLTYFIPLVKIEDPSVINKSYPSFWEDLIRLGFTIEY